MDEFPFKSLHDDNGHMLTHRQQMLLMDMLNKDVCQKDVRFYSSPRFYKTMKLLRENGFVDVYQKFNGEKRISFYTLTFKGGILSRTLVGMNDSNVKMKEKFELFR